MVMMMIILARSDLGDEKKYLGRGGSEGCVLVGPHPHTQADGELLKTEAQAGIKEKNLPTTSIHLLHVELM